MHINKYSIIFIVLAITSLLALILVFLNKDYEIPLISTGDKDFNQPPASTSEPAQPRITINPDGTKKIEIESSITIHFRVEVSGSVFNRQKYDRFILATLIQKFTSDLLEQIRKDYIEIILVFLVVATMPIILLRSF